MMLNETQCNTGKFQQCGFFNVWIVQWNEIVLKVCSIKILSFPW